MRCVRCVHDGRVSIMTGGIAGSEVTLCGEWMGT